MDRLTRCARDCCYCCCCWGNGKPVTLKLNASVRHGFRKPVRSRLTVYSDPNGMFRLRGRINGRPTRFLLDTGATFIALSSAEAERLQLPYKTGRVGMGNQPATTLLGMSFLEHVKLQRNGAVLVLEQKY